MLNRQKLRKYHVDRSTFDPTEVVVDTKILANLMLRAKRFGDICNGYTEEQVIILLKKYNNYAPDVCLEMIEKIEHDGFQTFDPPDYYDNKTDENPG